SSSYPSIRQVQRVLITDDGFASGLPGRINHVLHLLARCRRHQRNEPDGQEADWQTEQSRGDVPDTPPVRNGLRMLIEGGTLGSVRDPSRLQFRKLGQLLKFRIRQESPRLVEARRKIAGAHEIIEADSEPKDHTKDCACR